MSTLYGAVNNHPVRLEQSHKFSPYYHGVFTNDNIYLTALKYEDLFNLTIIVGKTILK